MDDDIVLVNVTGDKEVDRVLRLIIGSIELHLRITS
jgi:hypothetical protein